MTLKRTRKGETMYICANESCRHRVNVDAPADAQETEE